MNEFVIHFLWGILVQSTMKVSNYAIIDPSPSQKPQGYQSWAYF